MPSSGSTTSRIASRRSSTSGLSSVSFVSVIGPPECLCRRVLPRHPAEQGALDPGRELGHADEGDRVAKDALVRLAVPARVHQLGERCRNLHRLTHRAADEQVTQHRDAGLADRAAERVVRDVGDGLLSPGVLQADPERHLVATGRVDVIHLSVERLPQAPVVRVTVVIQDDLLVHGLELHHTAPKKFCTAFIPWASASTSSAVLYRYRLALVEDWTPRAPCSVNETALPRSVTSVGPRIRRPSISRSALSARRSRVSSCSRIAGSPTSV